MNDDHVQVFVAECRDSITELNNGLLAIENDPNDASAIESIFRTAHTLKGNFGAMGYTEASDLAHVLEDLLDDIRNGKRTVTPDLVDIAFEAIDTIEAIVDDIEDTGSVSTDPAAEIEQLREFLDGSASNNGPPASFESIENGGDASVLSNSNSDTPIPLTDEHGGSEFVATVEIGDSQMPAVDALLVLETIGKEFSEFDTIPDRSQIENGEYETSFQILFGSGVKEDVHELLTQINQISSFTIETVDSHAFEDDAPGSSATPTAPGLTDNQIQQEQPDQVQPVGSATETSPQRTNPSKQDESIKSIRIDADRLDELHGLVEQLVTTRITIRRAIENNELESARNSLKDLDKVSTSLQDSVTEMRLIPLRRVVQSLPRVVRDTARKADKKVEFNIYGEDVELDRTILSKLDDPLIHILRNAVDHGIEQPSEREIHGKSPNGTVELRAERDRDYVIIEVSDDGKGLDPDELREQVIERDILSADEASELPDEDLYDFIFHPGFSTASEVTDTSGRGVGMDVVNQTVSQLDGSVSVSSERGKGTTVTLRLPVSVAIVDVLFVEVGNREFGIPIKTIDEVSRATAIEQLNQQQVVRHNDEIYPVIDLHSALEVTDPLMTDGKGQTDSGMLIRIRETERPVALYCDAVSDQEEVVVKPMDGILSGIDGLSGTAILGDGNIVPILDVVTL